LPWQLACFRTRTGANSEQEKKTASSQLRRHHRNHCNRSAMWHTAELPPNVTKNISASFNYKLTKVPQPIKLVVRITLLVTFLKQLSEFYFLSN
jgi:hypothetical protein